MKTQFEDSLRPVWREPRGITLLLAASLVIMANSTISPSLPGLEAEFGATPNAELLTRLLVPAPSLSVVLAAPVAGVAVDRFGRRPMMIAGTLIFMLAGPAGLYLPSLEWIFVSRLALGVAVAMIMTAQTALIGDCFRGERRSSLMGLQVSVRNFGGMVFIVLAGLLAALSPRLPFLIYGLSILYLPLVWQTIRDVPGQGGFRPVGGGEAMTAPAKRWAGPIMALAGLQLLTAMLFFLNPTQIPYYAAALGYDSASATGAYLGILMLAGGGTALLYRRIKETVGDMGGYAGGFVLMAAGFAMLPAGGQFWLMLTGAALIGAGYAVVTPIFIAIALQVSPVERRGLVSGLMTTAMFTGQFASPLASTPALSTYGYGPVFYASAVVLAAMAAVSAAAGTWALRRRRDMQGAQI